VGGKWELVESPTTNTLNGVYFVNENDGWAVGNSGTILHYDGDNWQIVDSPTTRDIDDVCFVSSENGWAVGYAGVVLHFDGIRWEISAELAAAPRDVFFLDAENGWIASAPWYKSSLGETKSYGLYYFDGTGWHDITPPIGGSGINLYTVYFLDKNDGWVAGNLVGGSPDYFFAHYNGAEWEIFENDRTFHALFFNSPTDGWSASGVILHYDGASWSQLPDSSVGGMYSLHFTSEDDGWAVGYRAIAHHNGERWEYVAVSEVDIPLLWSVHFTSPANGWAVGNNGMILHYAVDH
jgi:photosystem II stability/assembly factor-like uncharacterized protein